MPELLEAKNISKSYETPRGPLSILNGVTLSLELGDAISIIGPSGTGKSTLLYILGALEPPTSGEVTLDGRNPFALSDKEVSAFRNQEVGFVFQDHCLLPQCTVLENVLIPTMVGTHDVEVEQRAKKLLDQVGSVAPARSSSGGIVGRRKAACVDRAGDDSRAEAAAVRRADGQSGPAHGGAGGGSVAGIESGLEDDSRRRDAQRGVGRPVSESLRVGRRTAGFEMSLVRRSLVYYWRTNLAVILGVATAVAVLSGALLVGDSVRASLRDLVLSRLGKTQAVVTSAQFFREQLAAEAPGAAPLMVMQGVVTHEKDGRREYKVAVYGVDDRFFKFNGYAQPAPSGNDAMLSPALARDLGAQAGDSILLRVEKPSAIPRESLQGRKEDSGRTLRLTASVGRSRIRAATLAGRCFRNLRFVAAITEGSRAAVARQHLAAAIGGVSQRQGDAGRSRN